jgi:large subunit ribosomal protein L19
LKKSVLHGQEQLLLSKFISTYKVKAFMNPYIKVLEQAQMEKTIPAFRTGDTLSVQLKVKETSGEGAKKTTRERLQTFEGIVLGRKNKGLNSSVTLHRILEGESVELVLPLYSPLVANIQVKRLGDVRKAKLYYLRPLRGKAARIKERYVRKVKAPIVIPTTESSTEVSVLEE